MAGRWSRSSHESQNHFYHARTNLLRDLPYEELGKMHVDKAGACTMPVRMCMYVSTILGLVFCVVVHRRLFCCLLECAHSCRILIKYFLRE